MQTTNRSDRVAELMSRANGSLQSGDAVKAMLYMRQALALRPGEAKAHRMVGQIYKVMGKDLLAQREFHAAAQLDTKPGTPAEATGETPAQAAGVPSQPAILGTRPSTLSAALGGLDPPAVATRPPAPRAVDPFDLPPDAAGGPVELNHGQQRVVLDMTMQLLAQLSGIEQLLAERGTGNQDGLGTIRQVRQHLGDTARQARDTWRTNEQTLTQAAVPAGPLPEAGRYQGIGQFSHTLGAGAVAEGEEVSRLQQLLNLEGLHVQVTGKYDTSTSLAVRKFQDRYHLSQRSGVVGGETRRLLNRLVAQVS